MRLRPRRGKNRIHKKTAPGSSPGVLVADPTAQKTHISVLAYGPTEFTEVQTATIADIAQLRKKHPVIWINLCGLGDTSILKALGETFGLHPLALEDSVNLYQRPKIEQYGDYYYIVARMAEKDTAASTEQLSIFMGNGFLITIQEKIGDCFDSVRERIRESKGKIRNLGADYLCYAILDATIDFYFPLLEKIELEVEAVEEKVIQNASKATIHHLYTTRHDLLMIRRAIWPLRDAISSMYREAGPLIHDDTKPYLRDCHDHTVQLIDAIENFRELISSLMEVYLSSASYKLNDVMRTLTVISLLFMPLNLIAGIYGMNFNPDSSPLNMPELNWRYGYIFALVLMTTAVGGMMWFFHRKGWLRE